MSTIASAADPLAPPPPPPPLDAELRLAIARGLAQARPAWEGRVRQDGETRHAVRLLAHEAYEAWLIGWPPGHRTTAHDHGGSAAAIVVVDGELTEHSWEPAGAVRRRLLAGDGVALTADVVHDVGNESPVGATSLHVYSPPLSRMTFYDETGTPDAVLEVDDETPVFDSDRLPLGLHPAVLPRG